MTEPVMKYGARRGKMNTMRRWIARASAREIRIFVIPGADVLRLYQTKIESGAILAANPREANVLLVMGELTDQLFQKAAIAYQQIPRPRVLVLAGPKQAPPLPDPNVQVALNDDFLEDALPQVRQLLQNHAWSKDAEPWEPEFLTDMLEDSENGGGHGHHHHDHGNGDDDEGEHDHGQKEDHEDHESHDHNDDHNHEHSDQENDDGHNHDHGDMDFMSMVAMTKNLPRPKDGLPMNRSEVTFGPFHPGLPGGLSVFMELDGDTVIKANVEGDVAALLLENVLPLEAKRLPDTLARLNPLTPQTYRLLAQKALSSTYETDEASLSYAELMMLEKERIASHLNWLATLAKTIGNEWLYGGAARRHAAYRQEKLENGELRAFLKQIRTMPYLQTKLTVGGIMPDQLLHHLSGPVAKAAGKVQDARSEEKLYRDLGWEPIINTENNAWGRLLVRMDEIKQSLALAKKAEEQEAEKNNLNFSGSGQGSAKIESPRGILSLRVSIRNGIVEELEIETPSKLLAGLVPIITEEAELSDALAQIASLDISPWEVQLKGMEE